MRKICFILVLAAYLAGCRVSAYQAFISQNLSNLRQIRPQYESGLRALEDAGRDPRLTKNDLRLIDDMIDQHEQILEAQNGG